jgi:hypothetical protein
MRSVQFNKTKYLLITLPVGLSVYPVSRTAFIIVIRYDIAARVIFLVVHHSHIYHAQLPSISPPLHLDANSKGKAIPLQALTGPEGSRRLRLPDFMT